MWNRLLTNDDQNSETSERMGFGQSGVRLSELANELARMPGINWENRMEFMPCRLPEPQDEKQLK